MIGWLRDRLPTSRRTLEARLEELEHEVESASVRWRIIGGMLNPEQTDKWWSLYKENERLRSELSMGPRLPH